MRDDFEFFIHDFRLFHQGEWNNLNLVVRYRYAAGLSRFPDFQLIARDVETLLREYPGSNDYWEKVNRALVRALLARYLSLSMVHVEMRVSPTPREPYFRTSVVTLRRPPSASTPAA